jgi:hypothetical protein
MGDECLASAPAFRTSASGSGYVVTLSENPGDWDSSEYKTREESVRRHLGEEYFFIRMSQERKTVSPFQLPKLPAPKMSVEAEVDPESGIKEIRAKGHRE